MVQYWKTIITDSWDIYKNNFRLLLVAHCIILVLYTYPQFIIINLDLSENLDNIIELISPEMALLFIALFLLGSGISLGAIHITYNAIKKLPLEFKHLFQQFYLLPQLILKYLVSGIITLIILYLFSNIIFAGIVFAIINFSLFFFYDYLILIEKLDFMNAIKTNFYLVSKNITLIIQYCLICFMITLVLSVLPILGSVLSQSFVMMLGIQLYIQLISK